MFGKVKVQWRLSLFPTIFEARTYSVELVALEEERVRSCIELKRGLKVSKVMGTMSLV